MKEKVSVTELVLAIIASAGIGWFMHVGYVDGYEPPDVQIAEIERVRVTAYCPCSKCCGKWADGVTASGHKIKLGDRFVAAPRSIPFGTVIVVPGYNNGQPVRVEDVGGAITEGRLDVFFDTHQEALNWGVQWLDIEKGSEL